MVRRNRLRKLGQGPNKKSRLKRTYNFDDRKTVMESIKKSTTRDVAELERDITYGVDFYRAKMKTGEEYVIFKTMNDAIEYAEAQVKDNLLSEPELFNQDWLQHHVDGKRMASEFRSDIENQKYEHIKDDPESFNLTKEDAEEENEAFQQMVNAEVENELGDIEIDPVSYLKEFGMESKIVDYIDVEKASKDAVVTDGFAHFIATYDGDYTETDEAFIVMRTN